MAFAMDSGDSRNLCSIKIFARSIKIFAGYMLNTNYTNNTNGNEWQIQNFDITLRQQVITLRGENDEFGGGKWSF